MAKYQVCFAIRLQDETNAQMYNAYKLHKPKGKWIQFPDLLLASKNIQLIDSLLALPCNQRK